MNKTRWNKRDNVWGHANSLFKWRFRSRRRRRLCCLSSLLANLFPCSQLQSQESLGTLTRLTFLELPKNSKPRRNLLGRPTKGHGVLSQALAADLGEFVCF